MTEPSNESIDADSDSVAPTGRFRIYLGAVAGVGKTCAMLDEGWRRAERGSDVVVGFVETHGRAHTAELIRDLEVVPRTVVNYRGTTFEEMDLQGVLAREPDVALVDELAHTNVPGSGEHAKRWEDVLTLLDAGIAVITTVNIQHLESLADAVEKITGIQVRERVPDWVVHRADQIELIDSSPEQLRRRMFHGNIYPAPKIPDALSHFFRTENLVALRELALRFLADETEEDLLDYLRNAHPDAVWDTTERILVAITSTPGIDGVLRRAARIASRVKGELHAVHVASGDAVPGQGAESIESVRRLADDVGAHWHDATGDDAAKAIVEIARRLQITQIVLGSERRSRWQEMAGGSFLRNVLRRAAIDEIDVHVIARGVPELGANPRPARAADRTED